VKASSFIWGSMYHSLPPRDYLRLNDEDFLFCDWCHGHEWWCSVSYLEWIKMNNAAVSSIPHVQAKLESNLSSQSPASRVRYTSVENLAILLWVLSCHQVIELPGFSFPHSRISLLSCPTQSKKPGNLDITGSSLTHDDPYLSSRLPKFRSKYDIAPQQ
jgi:hypothetical protein